MVLISYMEFKSLSNSDEQVFSCWELSHSILHVLVSFLMIVIDHSTLLLFNKSNMLWATLFFPFTLLVMLLEGGIALKSQFLS